MTLPERIKAASNVPHFISVVVNNRFCGFDAAIFFFDLKVMGACAAQWNDALQVCLVDAPPVVRNSRLNEPSGFESDVGRCHRPDAIVRLMVDAVYKQSGVLHMLVNGNGFVQLCSCKFINRSFISN